MELLIKKTIKILSFSEQNTLEISQIVSQLQPLIKCVSQERFIQKLKECQSIKIDSSKKDRILVSLNHTQAKESNDEKELNLFFKEDKANKSLYFLYRLILQAGQVGVNYSDLSTQFNTQYVNQKSVEGKKDNAEKNGLKNNKNSKKKNRNSSAINDGDDIGKDLKKLDITNVSHYCRKLYTLKFINILPEKLCKKAFATKFQEKCLQIDIKTKRKMIASQLNTEMDLEDNKKHDPWRYLKEDTFILNELTFNQNILLNFASYEAFLREGLYSTEIASKINKLGERKMLVRSLESIIEDYNVQSAADRQGRTFSLRYHIKSQIMADYIDAQLKQNKINIEKELEQMQRIPPLSQVATEQTPSTRQNNISSVQTRLQFSSTQINQPKELRHLQIKQEEKIQQSSSDLNKPSNSIQQNSDLNNKSQLISLEKKEENVESFTKRSELFNSYPKLNYSSFEHIFKYFQENEKLVQDLIQVSDKDFIQKCMNVPPLYTDSNYQKFSELLLKIIHETVEFNYVRIKKANDGSQQQVQQQQQQNSNSKKITKKQISRNKLNRYIYIFNKIEEKKVIKNQKLKKYIIGIEKNQGVGEIDKKTLENILNTFQYIGYIYVKRYKIDMTNIIMQNIVRSIVIHKDISENDPKVIKAEKTINKGLLKKGPKQDDSEISDSESDSFSNFQYSSSIQSKSQNKLSITKSNGNQGKLPEGKQSDITKFLVKRQRNIQPDQKIYYYDEEEDENENGDKSQFGQQNVKVEHSTLIDSTNFHKNNSLQSQLQEALANATRQNCEIPAAPEKKKIFVSLIFQKMEEKIKQNYEVSFDRIRNINFSAIYTNLYFKPNEVEFKYPFFQKNLCRNLLNLSQNTRKYPELMELELQNQDINAEDVPTVNDLLNEAFTSSNSDSLEDMENNKSVMYRSIEKDNAEDIFEIINKNESIFENIKTGLGELKGNNIKNLKAQMQDNILRFKSYLIRYPCRKLIDTKIRYQMVDYYSFLNQCVQNDSIKFFKLSKDNSCYEKVKLEEISNNTIDSIFYQINHNYYNHFNLSSQDN